MNDVVNIFNLNFFLYQYSSRLSSSEKGGQLKKLSAYQKRKNQAEKTKKASTKKASTKKASTKKAPTKKAPTKKNSTTKVSI